MAVNETIVTGRYFRRCTDAANKVWQRISFWHKASDCEFDDNKNAQTKVGAIKGITTSTSVTETGYAADMTTVKNLQTQIDELNSNLGAKLLWTNESTGSAFKEQTISISSTFDYCIIVFVHDTSSRLEEHAIIMVPRNSTQYYSAIGSRDQIRRDVKYSDTGIFIGNGIYLPNTIMNGYLIPYKIYGINITL